MLEVLGAEALSPFRITKLLDGLRTRESSIEALSATFIHFVDVERPLTAQELGTLERLLTYGPRQEPARKVPQGERLIVVPRAGTISPWSSKATDIARVCELSAIRRIERGIEYRLSVARPLGR